MKIRPVILALIAFSVVVSGSPAAAQEDGEAAYTRTIDERAAKIVAPLGVTNEFVATQVREIVAGQYRRLRPIHETRDQAVKAAKENPNQEASAAAVKAAQDAASADMAKLHAEFLKELSGLLTPEQVDQVKDGMTYGVLNVTYDTYMKMFPDLTTEQKTQIRNWLVEARELAMDQGSSSEKHAVFGKYKGRINNYLSTAGYDLKKAEQNLRK